MRTKKKSKLRNAEYYDIQQEFDELYKKSKKNCKFTDLLSIITSEENIKLAYRNIKKNHGSKTAGTDGKTIQDLEKWQTETLINHISLSIIVGIPSGLFLPFGFGISTLRIVCGL